MARGNSLDSNRIDDTANLEAALFELHHRCVVDAGSLGEDQDRWVGRVGNVGPKPLSDGQSILGLCPLKPDVGRGPSKGTLQDTQKSAMALSNLCMDNNYRFDRI